MSDYDSPWKEALDQFFPAFLAFFFPKVHGLVDWSRGYEALDQKLGFHDLQREELSSRLIFVIAAFVGGGALHFVREELIDQLGLLGPSFAVGDVDTLLLRQLRAQRVVLRRIERRRAHLDLLIRRQRGVGAAHPPALPVLLEGTLVEVPRDLYAIRPGDHRVLSLGSLVQLVGAEEAKAADAEDDDETPIDELVRPLEPSTKFG